MTTDESINAILTQLSAVAKAAMTAPERELRARPLVADEATVRLVASATARADLSWNAAQAKVAGVDVETWLQAVHIVDLPRSSSLRELLHRLHRVEAAAQLLRAGYTSGRSSLGDITWSGRG